jgi:hypothetical protein
MNIINLKKNFVTAFALVIIFFAFSNTFGKTEPIVNEKTTAFSNAILISQDFQVSFTGCLESIGVGLIPTANARLFVPAEFILAGDGQSVTPLVVRTARCSVSVGGNGSNVSEIVQIGAVIVPPDGTGDINNYTMFYYTSDLRLALRLLLSGVSAEFVPTIDYHKGNDNSFSVRVPLPGIPRLTVNGTVSPSPQPSGSFVANWWQKTSRGNVKMSTNVPVIKIGGANLTLNTNPNGLLGQIIGGNTLGFPIIQQFNTFANAQMNVTTSTP